MFTSAEAEHEVSLTAVSKIQLCNRLSTYFVTRMAEGETKQQLQPRRLTYCPPAQMQVIAAGRGKQKTANEAQSFVRRIPRMTCEEPGGQDYHLLHCWKAADSYQQKTCACERKTKNILCQACGHVFAGRIRMMCPLHPTTIHLMDIDCCPQCRASHLKEFSDVSMKRD